MFDRSHIVAAEDLKAAAERMAARDGAHSHIYSHTEAVAAEIPPRKPW